LLNNYFEDLINRSISNLRYFCLNVRKPKRMVDWIAKRIPKRYRIRRIKSAKTEDYSIRTTEVTNNPSERKRQHRSIALETMEYKQ